jgi:hypothetical protein
MNPSKWSKYLPSNLPHQLEQDLLVFKSKTKTVFHSSSWLYIFSNELVYFIHTSEEGNILAYFIGALSYKYGVKGMHIPAFTHCYCPVFDDSLRDSEKQELYSSLCAMLDEYNVVDFKFQRGQFDPLPFHCAGYQNQVLVTYLLEGSYETFWSTLNKNRVREIKKIKALVENGTLKVDTTISKNDFLKLYAETAQRGNFEYKKQDMISLYNHLSSISHKLMVIYAADNKALAFGYFPYDDTAVYNVINASVRFEDPILKTANLYIINEMIRYALETGRAFDFEGSLIPGVASFYRMLGGKQVILYRSTKSRSITHSLLRALHQMKKDRISLDKT